MLLSTLFNRFVLAAVVALGAAVIVARRSPKVAPVPQGTDPDSEFDGYRHWLG